MHPKARIGRSKAIIRKNQFEKIAWADQEIVCGIDEVGRGCLAGPLVTAAAILPPNTSYSLLKDSKILSPADRLKAYAWITKNCWYSFGIVHHRIIDERNIYQATLIAMKKALMGALSLCPQRPQAVVVDAMPLKLLDTSYHDIPVHYFTQGETRSSSIAAASIIAKVKRDQLMERLDELFPGYSLGQHKGYSTPIHMSAVQELNKTIIHRNSFLRKLLTKEPISEKNQQSIC